jgi:hypothetical protein
MENGTVFTFPITDQDVDSVFTLPNIDQDVEMDPLLVVPSVLSATYALMSAAAVVVGAVSLRYGFGYCQGWARSSTWYLGLTCALSYTSTYYWRYPIFVLPDELLHLPVGTVFGRTVITEQGFSLAMMSGFGAAKIPASSFVTSQFFFRHRFKCLLLVYWSSMIFEGGGIYFFDTPYMQVLCVFISSFISSTLFGMHLTYLEGRAKTEALMAVTTFFYIWAGNLARGAGRAALEVGVPGRSMPVAVGAVACVTGSLLLVMLQAGGGPTAEDIAIRCERRATSGRAQWDFIMQWRVGLFLLALSNSLLTGIRSFRDLFASDLFEAALETDAVPASFFSFVDVPGGVLNCAVLVAFSRVLSNSLALSYMFAAQSAFVVLVLVSTAAFQAQWISGALWQVLVGVGVLGAYSIGAAPVYDRLMAVTRTAQTCAFLVFLSDFCGYAVSVVIMMIHCFGEDESGSPQGVLKGFIALVYIACAATLLSILCAAYYFRTYASTTDKSLIDSRQNV